MAAGWHPGPLHRQVINDQEIYDKLVPVFQKNDLNYQIIKMEIYFLCFLK